MVSTQAAWLAARHEVTLVHVLPSPELAPAPPPGLTVRALQEVAADGSVRARQVPLEPAQAEQLAGMASRLVPKAWEDGWSSLTDRAVGRYLSRLRADLVMTTSPGTLAVSSLLPRTVPVVHLERLPVRGRAQSLTVLDARAAQVDRIVVGDPITASYLRGRLEDVGPVVTPLEDPLEPGYRPLSPRRDRLIVAAGRLTADQHLPALVRAFARFDQRQPGWRLRILGEGPMRAALENWARKEGLFDKVELPGVSLDMRTEWARASIAVGTPGGGVSLSVREAMAAGVPVVAVDSPEGARHLIEHGVTGWLVPGGSESGLAAGLLRLAEDADLGGRMGVAARSAASRWRADVVLPAWEAVLQEAVDGRRRHLGWSRGLIRPPTPRRPPVDARESARQAGPGLDLTPAACLHQTLAVLVGAASRVASGWFVLRPVGDRPARLIVPSQMRARLLCELASLDASETEDLVVLPGQADPGPGHPDGALREACAALRNSAEPVISIGRSQVPGLDPRRWLAHVEVEFAEVWDGRLVLPRPNDWAAELPLPVPLQPSEVAGVRVPTLALALEDTTWDRRFPIDAVYTWVDGSDPAWTADRDRRLRASTGSLLTKQSSGRARFTSRDELRYSLRSVHMFAPWLRRIFLVTAGQVPPWLGREDRIRVVDHREVLPPEALPTFNSHAIETGLHRIDGLAEHFIYFNDDVLLGRPVEPHQFFGCAGQAAVHPPALPIGLPDTGATPHARAGLNNRELLREAFGVTITRHLTHTPHPLLRATLREVEEHFSQAVERTARSPFRGDADVSMASSLVQHYGLVTGSFVELAGLSNRFVPLTSPALPDVLGELLLQRDADSFCLGDHHDWGIPESRVNALVHAFLETYFPVVPPWERIGAAADG